MLELLNILGCVQNTYIKILGGKATYRLPR
jgi:hypothetical protein